MSELLPTIAWVKNEPKKYKSFFDGSVFLVALQVGKNEGPFKWDYDVVEFDCDGEGACLWYRGKTEIYDAWSWDDFEYFALLEGDMPSESEPDEDYA